MCRQRESQAISVAKAKLEERVVSLEEAGLRARREADEQTAELEGLKTQVTPPSLPHPTIVKIIFR